MAPKIGEIRLERVPHRSMDAAANPSGAHLREPVLGIALRGVEIIRRDGLKPLIGSLEPRDPGIWSPAKIPDSTPCPAVSVHPTWTSVARPRGKISAQQFHAFLLH